MIKKTDYSFTQNKGKESENSYQKLKRSQWTGTQKHTVTKLKYFDGRGRLSIGRGRMYVNTRQRWCH